jgi:hypothetical protein
MGENLCQLYIRQGTDKKIYREIKKLKSKKITDPMKKWTNELNGVFSKEEIQITKKHMKKCSPFLTIKEMQTETTF